MKIIIIIVLAVLIIVNLGVSIVLFSAGGDPKGLVFAIISAVFGAISLVYWLIHKHHERRVRELGGQFDG